MKTRILSSCIVVLILFIMIPNTFAEEEILLVVENEVRKVYYTGENIISVLADSESASVIFETGKNAKLDVKAPKVYKVGPDLFILRNGEEIDAVTDSDECFFYATIETQEPEKIEIIFAFWPEYPETVENCETFEEEWPTDEFTDEQICGVGNVLDDGICVPSGSRAEDFRDAEGEIIEVGNSIGEMRCDSSDFILGFLFPELCPRDQFVVLVLVIVLPIAGIIVGSIIIWRKRK